MLWQSQSKRVTMKGRAARERVTDPLRMESPTEGHSRLNSNGLFDDEEEEVQTFVTGTIAPEFLERNAHVHEYVFGAIAELIDNALDARATRLDITLRSVRPISPMGLCFTDNGKGMTRDELEKMLVGFGKSTKSGLEDTVGQYGVGFKSGSMRIGKDALVLTKEKKTRSVGLLSQTWLLDSKKGTVEAPIVTWWNDKNKLHTEESVAEAMLQVINMCTRLDRDAIAKLFDVALGGHKTGTYIMIYNLRRGDKRQLELTVENNNIVVQSEQKYQRPGIFAQADIPMDSSLRDYCSVLYLEPKIVISIQGVEVKHVDIRDQLENAQTYSFALLRAPDQNKKYYVRFGYSEEAKKQGLCGMFFYNRNRLIQSYYRLGLQVESAHRMVGILGVGNCDALTPKHNKQEFIGNSVYHNYILISGDSLKKYWMKFYENKYDNMQVQEDIPDRKEVDWVECDSCGKWRKLPKGHRDISSFGETWNCWMNPDTTHNHCDIPEQRDDPSYNEAAFLLDSKRIQKQLEAEKEEPNTNKRKRIIEDSQEENDGEQGLGEKQNGDDNKREKKRRAIKASTPSGSPTHQWHGDLFLQHQNQWRHITHLTAVGVAQGDLPPKMYIKKMEKVSALEDFREISPAFYVECLPHKPHDSYEFARFFGHIAKRREFVEISLGEKSVFIVPDADKDKFRCYYNLVRKPKSRSAPSSSSRQEKQQTPKKV